VISFDGYHCDGGDIEGRLASRNSASLSGFSLGDKLTFATDQWRPYSLFVAGDASWSSGSLYPDGMTNESTIVSGPSTFAYVGGTFTAPDYLLQRLITNVSAADAATAFDTVQNYYAIVQSDLNALPYNAQADIIYGDGLLLTCNGPAALYHVKVDGAVLSGTNWIQRSGCKFAAAWVIDVVGTGDVTIKGQPFPGIVERVIYNVLGSGRVIQGQTGVAGHILAPRNTYNQTNGVTYGLVIVGNVANARQNNKPNCATFRAVTLSTKVVEAVKLGDTTIYVADLSEFAVGDLICINGDCKKITAGQITDVNGDGHYENIISVDAGFDAHTGDNIIASTTVNDPTNANRDTPLATPPPPSPYLPPHSSAAQLFYSIVTLAVLSQVF